MSNSEISDLCTNIETELAAMRQGLYGFAAGTAKHQFIEAKMKRVGGFEDQLASHIGGEQALLFSCQAYLHVMDEQESIEKGKRMQQPETTTTDKPAGTNSRYDILQEIRERLGPNSPRTLSLIDSLIAAWDVTDLLTEIFDEELAHVYIQAGFEAIEVTDDDL